LTAALLAALSWILLSWASDATPVPDVFPLELSPRRMLILDAAAALLGAAAFACAASARRSSR
jgi:hypothetical protein